jgi:hypothetical protein
MRLLRDVATGAAIGLLCVLLLDLIRWAALGGGM